MASSPTPRDELLDVGHLPGQIGKRSIRGGAIAIGGQAGRLLLRVGTFVALARLLDPADFGLVAMVTAITRLVMVLSDAGLTAGTIQREKVSHAQVSALFWIGLGVGLATAALGVAAAIPIERFYGEPRLRSIVPVLAATFVVSTLGSQQLAVLRRRMEFLPVAIVEVGGGVAASGGAIALAWFGANHWSLVAYEVILVVVTTLGAWIACPWRPGRPGWAAGTGDLVQFGGALSGHTIANYFARNLDNVLIGRRWGAQVLGYYEKAYELLMLPMMAINRPMGTVLIPALSRVQSSPERYRTIYAQALRLVTIATIPIAVLGIVAAEEITTIVLGVRWLPTAPLFRILSVSGLVQAVGNTTGWLFISSGRTREMFKWGALASTLIVASFFIGLPYGAERVALCYSSTLLLLAGPLMWYATRDTPVSLRDVAGAIWPTYLAGTGGGLAAWALAGIVHDLAASGRLGVQVIALGAVYLAVLWLTMDIRGLLRSFRATVASRDG